MKINELAEYLEKLEKNSSRIKLTKILAEVLTKSKTKEVDQITYLLLGRLAAQYENVVFNIAENLLLSCISHAYDEDIESVKKQYKKKGDIGDLVYQIAKNKGKKGKNPKVSVVFEKLLKIAEDEGKGSQERKVNALADLLSDLGPLSAKYISRIPIGKLRLGFSDKTVLDALSWMKKDDKSAKKEINKAYQVVPDVGLLAKKIKKEGIKKATKNVKPKVGIPVLPMLAQRLKKPSEMIEKMKEVAIEPKFDGLRVQIHYKKGDKDYPKAFTRNLNEVSWMFPELKKIGKNIKAKKAILDCEAMGVDSELKKLANFQSTMKRRRKHNIEAVSSELGIKFYVFDILLKNDKSFLETSYVKRRGVLEETIVDSKILEVVDFVKTTDPQKIIDLHAKYLKKGLEGVIVKKLDAKYVGGRTGWRWVKMKETSDSYAKLSDTIDAIVMGYYRGRGKRTKFGIGGFLAGIRAENKIKTITKVGTGLTDEQFRELKKRLDELEVSGKPKEYEVHKDLNTDVWVEPKLVVELAADDITKSPNHTAKFALRFPRLVKFRDDKAKDQVTSVSEIKQLYKQQ